MTRLLTTGWETGDIAEAGVAGGTGAQVLVTATPTPRSPGTYCLRFGQTSANGVTREFNIGSKSDVWIRFGLILHGVIAELRVLQLLDSGGTVQVTVTWSTDQLLRVYLGTNTSVLGTSVQQFSQDQWHAFEVRWQATSTTVGIVELWIDDTRWLNLTAIDNTATANLNIQTVRLGTGAAAQLGTNIYAAYDDLAINDTAGSVNNGRIGDGRVVLLKPNGAGSTTAQTRGGTDTGANWSQTSELPPSLAQYVLSATAATRDTYALENVPAGSWTVNCVEVLAFAQNSDAGAGSLGLTVKSGTTTNEGTAQALTITGAYYRQLYELDPNTSAAWAVAAVSALEAGTTVR